METKHRILITLLGVGTGHLVGRILGKTEEEKEELSRKGRWIGGLGTLSLTFVLDNQNDTVNYTLNNKGKRVYDGISKEYRINTRINEHKANGKIFDEVILDVAKTSIQARKLEQYRIKRYKPKYNIHYNS